MDIQTDDLHGCRKCRKCTTAWMESVESSWEQRPRITHDYKEVVGREKQDARAEEQLPRCNFLPIIPN